MANNTFRSASGANLAIPGNTAPTGTPPAGVTSGDLMIAVVQAAVLSPTVAPTLTPPSGWTSVPGSRVTYTLVGGAANGVMEMFQTVATGSDSYVWALSGSAGWNVVIEASQNQAVSTPLDTMSIVTFTAASTFPASGLSTGQTNERIVGWFIGTNAGTGAAVTWTAPGGMSEQFDSLGFEIADVQQAVAGSTGTKTATPSATADGAAYLVAIASTSSVLPDTLFGQGAM